MEVQSTRMVKKIARVVVSTMIHLVIFGLIGAVLTFLLSLADEEGAVLYVLWAVAGIFCGVMSYSSGLEAMTGQPLSHWTYRKDAPRTSLVVVAIKLFILVALSILYDRLGTESLSLALTYFVAVLLAALFMEATLRYQPTRVSKRGGDQTQD